MDIDDTEKEDLFNLALCPQGAFEPKGLSLYCSV